MGKSIAVAFPENREELFMTLREAERSQPGKAKAILETVKTETGEDLTVQYAQWLIEQPRGEPPENITDELDLTQFCKFNQHGTPYEIIDNEIEEYIVYHYDILIVFGKPYLYEHGVFKFDENGILTMDIIKRLILPDLRNDARLIRIYKFLIKDRRLQADLKDLNQHAQNIINFKNGMANVLTGEIHPHDPKYKSVNQIPHNFVPGLGFGKSVFRDFLRTRVSDEDQEMLLEFYGCCLLSPLVFPKFLMLVGMGNAGKSVTLGVLQMVLGRENVSAIPLQSLNERFTTASLLNKQANICGDLANAPLRDTSVIKQLTGDDLVKLEYKGGAIGFFQNRAKCVFSCNELPQVLDERSNGYFRRLLILRFNREGEFIPDLLTKLKDEREIETIISRLVVGAKMALERGKIFESGASLGEVSRLRNESDTVAAFLTECTVQNTDGRIKRPDLFKAYTDFCEQEDRQPLGKTAFFKALRTKNYREVKSHGAIYVCGLQIGFQAVDDDTELVFD